MHTFLPIERAAHIVGGLSALAKLLGVAVPTVYEWKTQSRPVPVKRCVGVMQATQGQVTLQELRPHDWQQIWPELAPPSPQPLPTTTPQEV